MKQEHGVWQWHRDIAYPGSNLAVGDPALSFVWTRPMLKLPEALPRREKKLALASLLAEQVRPCPG